jgi:hypothetical protein
MKTKEQIQQELAAATKLVDVLKTQLETHGKNDKPAILKWRFVPEFCDWVLVAEDPEGRERILAL